MEPEDRPWHALSPGEAAAVLASDPVAGLSAGEARLRLDRWGENRLTEPPARPRWHKFLDQFRSFLVIVLLFAAALAWTIGDLHDAIVIIAVILFNAALGFVQEQRAERTLAALKGMLAATVRVRRDGHLAEVAASTLVPGDLVLLEAGERVPADGRLLAAFSLEVDEAALTGESQPAGKASAALAGPRPVIAERVNELFMNTVVTRGRAELLVTATGMQSEMGRLANMIAAAPESQTPLQRQLDLLGKRLAMIAGGVVVAIFALTIARGAPWVEAAMTAIALAVAAIPEGMPAVVTVTLAVGMWRMARNRAIARRLSAVETLGSTTVICSDKTGTLTQNRMTARAGWYAGVGFGVTGEGYGPGGAIEWVREGDLRPLLLPMVLCTDARVRGDALVGDPTEGALYALAMKGGIDPAREQALRPRIAEIPFDSGHKFMATFHQAEGTVEIYIKGAPDVLLARSMRWQGPQGLAPLDDAARTAIREANAELAQRALRVLAVARRTLPAEAFDPAEDLWRWAGEWTFLGLAGLIDPPRPEAAAAIARCERAGVRVKMITGDHKATAAAIARELGLGGEVVTGTELDGMAPEELARRIDTITVFARVAPEHKVRIVEALRANGHITAMTGDGVNDAPALKAADIGVAMGLGGTAVTREAADLVLTDDNFATIVRAVEEGRVIYDNIVKFVRFQLSTNIGAILTVLCGALLGMPAPFTAIQLLWINIIMDGPPAMTLGLEPAQPALMQRPPRRAHDPILSVARLLRLTFYGAVMMAGTLAMFVRGEALGGGAYAVTLAFTTFVFFQLFNLFNARAEFGTAFNSEFLHNGRLWLSLLAVAVLQLVVVYWPSAQAIFDTTALTVPDLLSAAMVGSSVLLLEELRKLLSVRRQRR